MDDVPPAPPSPASPRPLTYPKAADYLGVSVSTLRRWVRLRKVKVVQLSDKVHYFWREDLDQLLGKQPGGTIYSEQRTPLDPNARLSHSQAADYLGVSIETLYRWVKAGKIRSVVPRKRGAGQRYYLPGDLERYLERRTQKELN